MNRKKILLVILLLIFACVGFVFLLLNLAKPKSAKILVESIPSSTVIINGNQLGVTPFQKDLEAGEVTLRLIPNSPDSPLVAYETKVKLEPQVVTVLKRTFGDTNEHSSGFVVSFERIGGKESEVSIISSPDGADVSLDGQGRGITPIKLSAPPGIHDLVLSAPSHKEESFRIQPVAGFRLIASVKLSQSGDQFPPNATPGPSPTPSSKSQVVEIGTTPTGYLRVRAEPNPASLEVTRVTPGSKYKFLEKDEKSGWYKVQISEIVVGWVSNEYTSLKEE